ncbi:hypothetical protein HZ994_17825 [Akkermansiaceae bacterium]|nr:hypothetical protein HZ994_17825 [Akkermansiaceae bacterium]
MFRGFRFTGRIMETTKKRIVSISVVQAGLVIGGLYGVLALFFSVFLVIFGLIAMVAGAGSNDAAAALGGGVGMIVIAVILPIVYGALGFVAGVIMALVYNLIAKMTGGLEMTVKHV